MIKKFIIILSLIFINKTLYAEDCIFNVKGECFGCDTPYSLKVGTPDNCLKHCPNRISIRQGKYATCDLNENTALSIYKDTHVDMKKCENEGFFKGEYNKCYSCNTTEAINISRYYDDEQKLPCTNRTIHYTDVTTSYSVLKCPNDRPLMDRFFMCWSCDEDTPLDLSFNQETNSMFCPLKRYLVGGWSYKCPKNKEYLTQRACAQCNGVWYQEKCYNKEDLSTLPVNKCAFISSNKCYTCDDLQSFEIGSKILCEEYCPNRTYNFVNMGTHSPAVNCALKKCPDDAPLYDKIGNCYSCDTKWEYTSDADIQNCNVCPNRYTDKNGDCLIKGQEPLKPTSEKYKNEYYKNDSIICPTDRPLKSWNNICYSCDTKENIVVDTACNFEKIKECNKICDNREILNTIGGNPSSILKCPDDAPLMDTVGMCWSCNTSESINLQYNEWKCNNVCNKKRYLSEDYCVKCPANLHLLSYDACQQCGGQWKDGMCF